MYTYLFSRLTDTNAGFPPKQAFGVLESEFETSHFPRWVVELGYWLQKILPFVSI